MRKLNLDVLKDGLPGISSTRGAFYREAVIVGLRKQGFSSGVTLGITGEFEEKYKIEWTEDIDAADIRSWKDEVQIANFGAVGIALLLMIELLGFKNFEEGIIGTGIDFWLSKNQFQKGKIAYYKREARLEISGILKETVGNTINMRVGRKRKQMKVSDYLQLQGWIVVVEFSTPKSKIVKK